MCVDWFLAGFEWGLSGNSLDLHSNYWIYWGLDEVGLNETNWD